MFSKIYLFPLLSSSARLTLRNSNVGYLERYVWLDSTPHFEWTTFRFARVGILCGEWWHCQWEFGREVQFRSAMCRGEVFLRVSNHDVSPLVCFIFRSWSKQLMDARRDSQGERSFWSLLVVDRYLHPRSLWTSTSVQRDRNEYASPPLCCVNLVQFLTSSLPLEQFLVSHAKRIGRSNGSLHLLQCLEND